MTFVSIIDYLIGHPAFCEAVDSYNRGNEKPLKNILIDLQIHSYQKTAQCASKTYGLNKWQNSADIKVILRELPPPDNLDYTLPIPLQKPKPVSKKRNPSRSIFGLQMNLFI